MFAGTGEGTAYYGYVTHKMAGDESLYFHYLAFQSKIGNYNPDSNYQIIRNYKKGFHIYETLLNVGRGACGGSGSVRDLHI